jgi:hypothetical protein
MPEGIPAFVLMAVLINVGKTYSGLPGGAAECSSPLELCPGESAQIPQLE